MSRIRLFGATLIVVLTLVLSGNVAAQDLFCNVSANTTSSWFTVDNWSTSYNGTGDHYLPVYTNNAYFDGGTCLIDGNSTVFVNKVASFAGWQGDGMGTLDIDQGSTLIVSNYFNLGNGFCDGTVNLRGTLNVVKSNINGCSLAGYRAGLTNSTAVLNIDGGTFSFAEGGGTVQMAIGGSSTGVVEITNGGMFLAYAGCNVGSGMDPESDGTFIIQDGICTNTTMTVGREDGTGRVIINGGGMYSTTYDSCITVGYNGGVGLLEVNGGEFVGKNAFNDTYVNANRSMMNVGYGTGSTGKFVQDGGYVEVVGVKLGESGGSGTAIISNGLFNAMCNNGSWPCYAINDGGVLTIAGGEFHCYTNSAQSKVYNGGILEFVDGIMSVCEQSGVTLFTYSNSTIRVVGPKCDIDVGWWRHNSGEPQYTTMEIILTQDAGHLSTFKSPRTDQPTALPGTMDVGFSGGACLLSTNQFACMYAGSYFYTTYVNPANYGLDLWDVAKSDVATGGDNLNLTLKDGASKGTASLPSVRYVSFAPASYGYVDVENLNVGSLPELTVIMSMTAGAKTLDAVVQDLQTAGYTNSVKIDSQTIAMKIPADVIAADDETFAWDFSEFDGTVNATVSAIAFNFNPQGSIFLIQ